MMIDPIQISFVILAIRVENALAAKIFYKFSV